MNNLVNTLPGQARESLAANPGKSSEHCLAQLREAGGRVLLRLGQAGVDSDLEGLLRVQLNLLQHYFRLQQAEGNLRAKERSRAPEPNVLRQIERERQRLGAELHTGVGQLLSAIRLQLEIVSSNLTAGSPVVQTALERISALSADALEQVRSIAKRLHPPEWQRLTLESALEQLWDLSGIPQTFEAHLRLDRLPQQPELDAKVLIYRAAQEAISNLVRHSRATRAELTLELRDRDIALRVEDNGIGFDVKGLSEAPPSLAAGIGLRTIREQTEHLGGSLQIESGSKGTRLLAVVPLDPSAE